MSSKSSTCTVIHSSLRPSIHPFYSLHVFFKSCLFFEIIVNLVFGILCYVSKKSIFLFRLSKVLSRRSFSNYVFLAFLALSLCQSSCETQTKIPILETAGNDCYKHYCKVTIDIDVGDLSQKLLSIISGGNKSSNGSLNVNSSTVSLADLERSQSPLRIICQSLGERPISLSELCIDQMPKNTKILEIFNTSISRLERDSFIALPNLKRLSLRRNQIIFIADHTFRGLEELRRLDLSYNRLAFIDGEQQFNGLRNVNRLKLGHNPLREINRNLLKELPTLKALELSDTLLVCDCMLAWLLKPIPPNERNGVAKSISVLPVSDSHATINSTKRNLSPAQFGRGLRSSNAGVRNSWNRRPVKSVKKRRTTGLIFQSETTLRRTRASKRFLRILGNPTCHSPANLMGTKLKKLDYSLMVCDPTPKVPIESSAPELSPGLDQVVFAGDSLRLSCRVIIGEDSPFSTGGLWWKWGGKHLEEVVDHQVEQIHPIGNTSNKTLTEEIADPFLQDFLNQGKVSVNSDRSPNVKVDKYGNITVKTRNDQRMLESSIEIPSLSLGHSGEWSCIVDNKNKNSSQSVSIYVIHHGTKYCPNNITSSNKGMYTWPRSVSGVTVNLPCQAASPQSWTKRWSSTNGEKENIPRAIHKCDINGQWVSLNTTICPYVSETTRILQHFASTNITYTDVANTQATLIETTRTLRNFSRMNAFSDPVDVDFLAKTIGYYVDLVEGIMPGVHTAEVLVDIIGGTLDLPKDLLSAAEESSYACTHLLQSLWKLVNKVPLLTRADTKHLNLYQMLNNVNTMEGFREDKIRNNSNKTAQLSKRNTMVEDSRFVHERLQIKHKRYAQESNPKQLKDSLLAIDQWESGIVCIWFRKNLHSTDRHLRCTMNNYQQLYAIDEDLTDARINIPSNVFMSNELSSDKSGIKNETIHPKKNTDSFQIEERIQFFVYDSAKLFSSPRNDDWQITSAVIGVRVNNMELTSTGSVYITLRSAIYSPNVLPAWWETKGNGSGGHWSSNGCKIMRVVNSLVLFRCNRLAHFGLLQDMADLEMHRRVEEGASFKTSPIAVYIGSGVCCLFLMASITTWGIHHVQIETNSKNKHSFINTWVALLFLVALFTVGVHQTESVFICRLIGLCLHYLTTCVLLWIIVSVTNLYKKVAKTLRPPLECEDPPADSPLPPKPMLRFYLVGWGIALIVCGISAAVNQHQYSTYEYCFLAWNPSLAAFYAPMAALSFILATFFLLTQCILRSDIGNSYSEQTANTETTELELLDSSPQHAHNPTVADDELSVRSESSNLSLLDAQHSPITQLRAHAVTLLLLLLTWASAAITTASPFGAVIPYHDIIFSIVYAICSSSLGIFVFVFFCLSRSDVTEAWRDFSFRCRSSAIKDDETLLTVANNAIGSCSESTTTQTPPISNATANNHVQNSSPLCAAPSIHSLESSNTKSSQSRSIRISNNADSVVSKTSNALHALNLSSIAENSQYAPEMFYNPKQACVAKRFFQKQRLKQMMKQNNLEMNRADSDGNSSAVYRPVTRLTRNVSHSESEVPNFDPSYLNLSNKVNNTNIHVDSMYNMGKHNAKSLTPEILCVLGPQKDSCSIVSSIENDQHQWPINTHHHCNPNQIVFYPKHPNIVRYPTTFTKNTNNTLNAPINLSSLQACKVDNNSMPLADWVTTSPLAISPQARMHPEGNRDEWEANPCIQAKDRPRRRNQRYQKRTRRKRSGVSKGDAKDWSPEEGRLDAIPANISLSANSSPSHFSHTLADITGSFSPPPPLPPELLNFSPSTQGELEWLHLLKKREMEGRDAFLEKESNHFCLGNLNYNSCSGDSDGLVDVDVEDADVDGANEVWDRIGWRGRGDMEEFEGGRTCSLICEGSFEEGESDGGSSSVATSLLPGVDTPPTSLPVTDDSPFDSPQRRYHRRNTTPDTLSVDSESLISPIKGTFPSFDMYRCDTSTLQSPLTPILTLTSSTPIDSQPIISKNSTQQFDNNDDVLNTSKGSTAESCVSYSDIYTGVCDSSLDTVVEGTCISRSNCNDETQINMFDNEQNEMSNPCFPIFCPDNSPISLTDVSQRSSAITNASDTSRMSLDGANSPHQAEDGSLSVDINPARAKTITDIDTRLLDDDYNHSEDYANEDEGGMADDVECSNISTNHDANYCAEAEKSDSSSRETDV